MVSANTTPADTYNNIDTNVHSLTGSTISTLVDGSSADASDASIPSGGASTQGTRSRPVSLTGVPSPTQPSEDAYVAHLDLAKLAASWYHCRGEACKDEAVTLVFEDFQNNKSNRVCFQHPIVGGSCMVTTYAEVKACREGGQICLKISEIHAETSCSQQFWLQELDFKVALSVSPPIPDKYLPKVAVKGLPCSLSYVQSLSDFSIDHMGLDSLILPLGIDPGPSYAHDRAHLELPPRSVREYRVRSGDRIHDILLKRSGLASFSLSRTADSMQAMATVYR